MRKARRPDDVTEVLMRLRSRSRAHLLVSPSLRLVKADVDDVDPYHAPDGVLQAAQTLEKERAPCSMVTRSLLEPFFASSPRPASRSQAWSFLPSGMQYSSRSSNRHEWIPAKRSFQRSPSIPRVERT